MCAGRGRCVAILAASDIELAVLLVAIENKQEPPSPRGRGEGICCSGSIGGHQVVVAVLARDDPGSAARVVAQLRHGFPDVDSLFVLAVRPIKPTADEKHETLQPRIDIVISSYLSTSTAHSKQLLSPTSEDLLAKCRIFEAKEHTRDVSSVTACARELASLLPLFRVRFAIDEVPVIRHATVHSGRAGEGPVDINTVSADVLTQDTFSQGVADSGLPYIILHAIAGVEGQAVDKKTQRRAALFGGAFLTCVLRDRFLSLLGSYAFSIHSHDSSFLLNCNLCVCCRKTSKSRLLWWPRPKYLHRATATRANQFISLVGFVRNKFERNEQNHTGTAKKRSGRRIAAFFIGFGQHCCFVCCRPPNTPNHNNGKNIRFFVENPDDRSVRCVFVLVLCVFVVVLLRFACFLCILSACVCVC